MCNKINLCAYSHWCKLKCLPSGAHSCQMSIGYSGQIPGSWGHGAEVILSFASLLTEHWLLPHLTLHDNKDAEIPSVYDNKNAEIPSSSHSTGHSLEYEKVYRELGHDLF